MKEKESRKSNSLIKSVSQYQDLFKIVFLIYTILGFGFAILTLWAKYNVCDIPAGIETVISQRIMKFLLTDYTMMLLNCAALGMILVCVYFKILHKWAIIVPIIILATTFFVPQTIDCEIPDRDSSYIQDDYF